MTQTRSYTVVLHPEPRGGFSAHVPAFPGIKARGEDEQHTLHSVRVAIEAAIADRLASGGQVPAGDGTYMRTVTVPVPAGGG